MVDCVVLDYMLPDLKSRDVALGLRDIRADIPIIVSTGHGIEVMGNFVEMSAVSFSRKPFTGRDIR